MSDRIRNRATPEGRELAAQLVRLADEAEPKARLRMPDLPPRCNSCAFRSGDHVANGSPQALLDAIKCVVEGHVFECHEPARKDQPCSGWAMCMLANDKVEFGKVPWDFIGGEDEG